MPTFLWVRSESMWNLSSINSKLALQFKFFKCPLLRVNDHENFPFFKYSHVLEEKQGLKRVQLNFWEEYWKE